MYTRKELLARSTCGRLLADRDQSIAPTIKRMTRINDFHLFAGGYVIVTLVGISRRPRAAPIIAPMTDAAHHPQSWASGRRLPRAAWRTGTDPFRPRTPI